MAEPKKPRKPRASKSQKDAVRKANEQASAPVSREGLNPSQDPGRSTRIERIRRRFEEIHRLKEGEKFYPLACIPKPPPLHPFQKLELFGLEEICKAITGGTMLRELSDAIGVGVTDLVHWVGKSDARSIAVREARRAGAMMWDEMALEVLIAAQDAPMPQVIAAKEVASHYRWRASKMNPKDYGDKIEHKIVPVTDISDDELVAKLRGFGLDVASLDGPGMMGAAPVVATDAVQHASPISPGRAAGGNVIPLRTGT